MARENRRKYFREELKIPARWRALTNQEIEIVKSGFGNTLFKRENLPGPIDELMEQIVPGSDYEPLYQCLQLLNNKLDFIIDQIFLKTGDIPPNPCEVTEISGSGLKFHAQDFPKADGLFKIILIMPGTFQYQLEVIIETVRVEMCEEGLVVAAKIIGISEEDRDAIIKVVLQKQRMDIRKKRMRQEG